MFMAYQKLPKFWVLTGTYTYKTNGNTIKSGGKAIVLVLQDKTRNDAAHTSNIAHSDCHTAAQSTTHELHTA